MVGQFIGPLPFNEASVSKNAPDSIGVYYCGRFKSEVSISPVFYVGMSEESIRGRLQDHVQNDRWPDVTHFGYEIYSTEREAENQEESEIARLKPKYNEQGK